MPNFLMLKFKYKVGSTEQIKANHRDYHVMITRGNKVMNLADTHLFNDDHYFIFPKIDEMMLQSYHL